MLTNRAMCVIRQGITASSHRHKKGGIELKHKGTDPVCKTVSTQFEKGG